MTDVNLTGHNGFFSIEQDVTFMWAPPDNNCAPEINIIEDNHH